MSLISNPSHQFFGILAKNHSFHLDFEEKKTDALFFKYIGKLFKENEYYTLFTTKKNFSFTKVLKEIYYYNHCVKLFSIIHIKDNEWVKFLKKEELKTLDEQKTKTLEENFPALEPSDLELTHSFFPEEPHLPYASKCDYNTFPDTILQKLGYGAELTPQHGQLLLAIPSPEMIRNRMQTIFDESKIDYSVKILESPSIFSDQDFIDAYLTHDAIITTGKEELHDHFLHVIPVTSMMLENPRGYIFEKRRIQQLLTHRIEKIKKDIEEKKMIKEDQEILWLALSATVDHILSIGCLYSLQSIDEPYLIDYSYRVFFDFKNYLPYLKKRFPEKFLDSNDSQSSTTPTNQELYLKIIENYQLSGYRKES